MWPIFKVFINFATALFLFYVLILFVCFLFGLEACGILASSLPGIQVTFGPLPHPRALKGDVATARPPRKSLTFLNTIFLRGKSFLSMFKWRLWVTLPTPSPVCHLIKRLAAAAKSLQSCPTPCDPIDGSSPGSPVPGILQARTLEWLPFPSPMRESEREVAQSCPTLSYRVLFNTFIFPFQNTGYIWKDWQFKIKHQNENISYLFEVGFWMTYMFCTWFKF